MKIRIGSRKSKLAVAQAHWIGTQLLRVRPSLEITYTTITTSGDQNLTANFKNAGGKGLFVREIETALLNNTIDLAVHSLKDVPSALPSGLLLGPTPAREDTRDAVLSRFGELLGELPRNSTVGTSSIRRKAQILRRYRYRSYHVDPLRGNIDTRLQKLHEGQYDAIVLALAGLKRLGLATEVVDILDPNVFLPAPCQGALGLEVRESDLSLMALLQLITDPAAEITARAERAFLQGLGGDCDVPVGAFSRLEADILKMKVEILSTDGSRSITTEHSGPQHEAELVGYQAAERLLHDGGAELLDSLEDSH